MGSDDDDHDHKHHRLDVDHKATLAAVSSLFAVTLIVILFFLYMKYRQNRRHQRRRIDFVSRLITAHNNPSRSEAFSDHPSHKNAVGGLDPTIINSLPEFLFKASGGGGGEEAVECSVCLGALADEVKVRLLPNCRHVFHVDCVDMWLGSHTTCPLCRAEVEPRAPVDDQQEPSGAAAEQQQPTAPPVDEMSLLHGSEALPEIKPSSSSGGSRLSSFRRMLSRERSSMRSLEGCGDAVSSSAPHHDLERQ